MLMYQLLGVHGGGVVLKNGRDRGKRDMNDQETTRVLGHCATKQDANALVKRIMRDGWRDYNIAEARWETINYMRFRLEELDSVGI